MLVIFYGELKIGHQKMGSLSGLAPSLEPGLDSTLQNSQGSISSRAKRRLNKLNWFNPLIISVVMARTVTFSQNAKDE